MRKLPFLLVALFCPLLLNAATFGPEVPAARPQYFSAFGQQASRSVACDGQQCVALWIEFDFARKGVYSSVIDATGNVQPASSTLVKAGQEDAASLVWTGDHYLAVWYDLDGRELVAAPLSRDGRISGKVQTLTQDLFPVPASTRLAWNGHRAFAVFSSPSNVLGLVLNADGSVVRSVSLPAVAASSAGVAAAGQTFGVVWTEPFQSTTTVKFQRYADDGSVLDTIILDQNLPVAVTKAGIAGNATQFGIAYTPAVDATIHRFRVDASTGALETLPVVPFVREVSGVYWSGDDFVAYGGEGQTIGTERFSFDALRVFTVSPKNGVTDARIAPSPTGSIAVWTDARDYTPHVFGALLDNDATAVVKGDLAVSRSALAQTHPALATSGNGALLAWSRQYYQGNSDIVVQRLDTAGNPIDETPITLATNVNDWPPSAVWLGNAYLVAWRDDVSGVIVGKRVSPSGVVLDPNPISLATGFQSTLATNGTTTILVFATNTGISVARLKADGTVLDTQPVTVASPGGRALSVANNGSEFAITWSESKPDGFEIYQGDIFAIRLTATGQPMDAAPIAIANGSLSEFDPAIASDGHDFLIAYIIENGVGVVTKRLLAEGVLAGTTAQDEGTVVDATGGDTPVLAWTGTQYVIAWSSPGLDDNTLVSTTLDRTGAPLDVPRAIGRSDSLFKVQAAIIPIQATAVVAYSRGNAADEGIPRLFTRQILNTSPRGRGVRH